MNSDRRRAGVCVPLFSLRSLRSWGIGEFRDLVPFGEWLQLAGHPLLQILPLNELAPGETSPYSALSAMALDPRYIAIDDVADAEGAAVIWQADITAVRNAPRIAHREVVSVKLRALRLCFDRFLATEWRHDTPRAADLRAYIASESWWIDDYALYRACRAAAGERPWVEWHQPLRDREPAAIQQATAELADEMLFYQYVQWIAADQWTAARRRASVDVIGDFPFMVTLDSADVWSRQREFLLDASVGTPPDAFSSTGQEWGLPPYKWDEVRQTGFEWLRRRARRTAQLYDGFRVDHLVGFYRTYVRPYGGGAYFSPASEDDQRALGETIMQILMSSGSEVSVEDLGTVPDFVRASVAQLGLPGYRVLRWEKDDPRSYPELSVAMTGTHDTTALAVWWESLSDADRRMFAEMPSIDIEPVPEFQAEVRDAILSAMYQSSSRWVLLPIQDLFGWTDRINLPATIGDWNWTFVLPWPCDEMTRESAAVETAHRVRALARSGGR